jgi:hypothetical protein
VARADTRSREAPPPWRTASGGRQPARAAILFVLFSSNVEDVSLSLSKHRPNRAGWFAEEITDDENAYEAVACLICTQTHLVDMKTGKVLGRRRGLEASARSRRRFYLG